MSRKTYYSNGIHYHKSDIPRTLHPFVDYLFSSGGFTGDDYKIFEKKFKNVIKKSLPEGYEIHSWNSNHYECSWVIKTPSNNYIYSSISDVRFFQNEWFTSILIRTMRHDKDWHGGHNNYTNIFTFTKDVERLEKTKGVKDI